MKNLSRRLVRLEARAAVVTAETTREPHILCFVDTDMKVACEFNLGTGVWTHFENRPTFTNE